MKTLRLMAVSLAILGAAIAHARAAQAQSDTPLALTLNANGPITSVMLDYFKRGIQTAEQRNADLLIIQLNTPGGDLLTTIDMMQAMRASKVPVVVFVGPNGAIAASAGALVTMAGHASAMAPETAIGASSPISGSGADLDATSAKKAKEITKAAIQPLVEPRGPEALQLAYSMVDDAKAVSAQEALKVHLIDFIAPDVPSLLKQLDGFTVKMADGPRTLHTANAHPEPVALHLIEQLLLMLTDPNIAFLLLAIGVQAILIEISSPGGWVAGFIGVVCLALATYGMGVLPVNWFGLVFMLTAFVLFILDIKAPTHGALTTAGVGAFIVGALILFNSPGTPQFQRVSIPLVIIVGLSLGAVFAVIMGIALRAQRAPVRMGLESLAGRTGMIRNWAGTSGQVQVGSELWSAEPADGAEKIRKGDNVEVVKVEGLRLKVRKK
ncbi:MAG: NfeD family protein [Bacteroidota bacterium]